MNRNKTEYDKERPKPKSNRWIWVVLFLILGSLGVYYNMLYRGYLANSAALYVGLPLVLALMVSLLPRAKSVTGTTVKVLTVALLLSAPILNEGFICIIMAAPLFYGVAIGISLSIDSSRKKKADGGKKLQMASITILMAIASLEGTHESFTFQRDHQTEYSRIVNADISSIREHLAATPSFEKSRPLFLRIFPLPVSVEGSGLAIGDERKLHFVYNKWFYFNAHEGDTVFRVAEASDNYIRFDIPSDDSYLSNYLSWQSSEILLTSLDQHRTKVTWKLNYQRKLDPIWYFGPLQYYAAKLTAKTLIDNVADPAI